MTEEEKRQEIGMLAGLALPGVIGRAAMYDGTKEIVEKAYEIAEALVGLLESKEPKETD